MVNKEQRSKKSIAAEVIYSEKANKIYAYIQDIKEGITNIKEKDTELLKKIDWLGEELMRQDIRVATVTGLIEKHPYPTCCEAERQRLGEVNKEIEDRVNSKNFPH
jgi:primosomal protein N''